MSSILEDDDTEHLLLHHFPTDGKKIDSLLYVGSGSSGHVFKARIDGISYAWKWFEFDNPEMKPSRLRGLKRRAVYDPFFIECRANGTIIQSDLNGQITPFCYGWLNVPTRVEKRVVWKHPQCRFERPPRRNDKIKSILFEWIDGEALSAIPINTDMAIQARSKLKALHSIGIVHGDLVASNLLVRHQQLYLLDLGASITLPHIEFSLQEFERRKQFDIYYLETGFMLLSELPINDGIRCVADKSCLEMSSLKNIDIECLRRFWAPPQFNLPRSRP